ncbi:hypothetical protein EC991_002632 [Linnemannia zychae]|nr:hypothetical protein EC991_002632 [Linnemannia zychae]
MSLPWEPPPISTAIISHNNQFHNNTVTTTSSNTNSGNNSDPTPNDNTTNNTLGDFDVLLSFLHLERISMSAPSTEVTKDTTSAATSSTPPEELTNMTALSEDEPNDTAAPSASTTQLGDLSMVMRYLQAHRTLPSSGAQVDRYTFNTSSLPIPAHKTQPTLSKDLEVGDTDNNDNESLKSNRRRLKKKATKKLPIDEPSSSSCGGWVSSESDHREVMGPEPDPAYDISNPSNATDSSIKEQQQQQQQELPKQPTDNNGTTNETTQCDNYSLSTSTVSKPNYILLPSPTAVATTTTITTTVTAAVASTASVLKRKRPWRAAKVLKEMKALFMAEQRKRDPSILDNHRTFDQPTNIAVRVEPGIDAAPVTIETAPGAQKEEDQELFLNQTPGYEPELLWRPRTHYNNFWRSCTATTSDHCHSSSSEGEVPSFRSGGGDIAAAASASAATLDSTTSTSSCLSEIKSSTNTKARQLLAMRMRDTFLVPKGNLLLNQALSRAAIHIPDSKHTATTSLPLTKEIPKDVTISNPSPLELGTMKTATRTTTTLSAPSKLIENLRPDLTIMVTTATTMAQLEQTKPTPPPPPKVATSDERVFIFVDNSNILHGFYHVHEAQRTDGSPPSDKSPAPFPETVEDGMDLATPTSTTASATTNDDGHKSFPVGTCAKTSNSSIGSSGGPGPRAKMARGSHLLPKFNYSKFFELLKRDRTASRQVLVGSSPLFQELDEAMEHQYETIILRRVKKFVQGELGVVPVPVKQLRYPSNNYDNVEQSLGDKSSPSALATASVTNTTTATTTTTTTTTAAATPATTAPLTMTVAITPAPASSGARGEQAVDELLHLKMLETLLDHEPATMVLATGDGGDSEFGGGGFYAVIKRALDRGWHVEVVSWEDQLSGVYLELALEYGYNCDHKLSTTGYSSDKRCHPSESAPSPVEKKKQTRSAVSKKQRARAQAQAQEKERMKSMQRGSGHLRVWCLDWYGDMLLQTSSSSH